jgi:hypothetical protein
MIKYTQKLEAKSFRECAFYIDYLRREFRDVKLDDIDHFNNINECIEMIEKEVAYLAKNSGKPINQFISKIQTDFKAQQLRDEDLLWLDKSNDRFCNWVWCYLKSESSKYRREDRNRTSSLTTMKLDSRLDDILGRNEEKRFNYADLHSITFKNTSNNLHDRRKDIIESFLASEVNLTKQKEMIQALISKWSPIFNDKRIVNWLEKNNSLQYEWAWEYLNKFDSRIFQEIWIPTNDNELKNAIVTLFDMLQDRPDRKTLLIGNIKRAWSQKKFRDKNEGKKAYSISMTEKTKQQLDNLAEQKGLKINETIEQLIKNEFEKLKD